MAFHIGQKVVRCMDPAHRVGTISIGTARRLGWSYPEENDVVTIRAINVGPVSTILRFVEHHNEHFVAAGFGEIEPGFDSRHFRPLVERETDISELVRIADEAARTGKVFA